jgi:hypothetical protein
VRALSRLAAAVAVAAFVGGVSTSSAALKRVDVGHNLSIVVPAGWRVSHKRFTPCSNPIERFSLLGPEEMLTVEERLAPLRAELIRRPRRFSVRGGPTPLECCAIPGRRGWVVHFGDHGRAFYVYLYSGRRTASTLLRILGSLRVA